MLIQYQHPPMQSDLYSMSLLIGKKCFKGIAGDSNNPISWLSHFQCTIESTPWVVKPGKNLRFLEGLHGFQVQNDFFTYLCSFVFGKVCSMFFFSNVPTSKNLKHIFSSQGSVVIILVSPLTTCGLAPWYQLGDIIWLRPITRNAIQQYSSDSEHAVKSYKRV